MAISNKGNETSTFTSILRALVAPVTERCISDPAKDTGKDAENNAETDSEINLGESVTSKDELRQMRYAILHR